MSPLSTTVPAAFLVTLVLSGCASLSSAPRSLLDGNPPARSLASNLAPVQIVSVDGKIVRGAPVPVAPGMRAVVLQSGTGPNPTRQINIAVAPCTRYYLAAQRASVTARTWEMTIVSSEPVAACDPAEELKKS